ncbi:hypothetical protein AVEN_191076-1 [Araneus ventricosus]|uniref:Uncharacterized protein n=1 Tax=Araneus ventricosus TaxID=182803 RepID=A0A4Y2AXY3_ARAVE|nr:hypothetical protein AVEN_191076-1 [Araneus ventricosus]
MKNKSFFINRDVIFEENILPLKEERYLNHSEEENALIHIEGKEIDIRLTFLPVSEKRLSLFSLKNKGVKTVERSQGQTNLALERSIGGNKPWGFIAVEIRPPAFTYVSPRR